MEEEVKYRVGDYRVAKRNFDDCMLYQIMNIRSDGRVDFYWEGICFSGYAKHFEPAKPEEIKAGHRL